MLPHHLVSFDLMMKRFLHQGTEESFLPSGISRDNIGTAKHTAIQQEASLVAQLDVVTQELSNITSVVGKATSFSTHITPRNGRDLYAR